MSTVVETFPRAAASEPLLPPPERKAAAVRQMFEDIAPRYDLLNHLLSWNQDRRWRRKAVDLLLGVRRAGSADRAMEEPRSRAEISSGEGPRTAAPKRAGLYLDACGGTLDLALEVARRPGFSGTVVGSDFSFEMLRRGAAKAAGTAVEPACADVLRLPFGDATFDGATVGFGIRNVAGLDEGLRELARVLRPGGRLVILEFATPRAQPFRALYLFYFRRLLPRIGRVLSGHATAYSYLPESVLAFPEPPQLAERMRAAGFTDVTWETYLLGSVAAHVGTRPGAEANA